MYIFAYAYIHTHMSPYHINQEIADGILLMDGKDDLQ